MKRKVYFLLSLVMIASMLLSACSASTPVATQPVEVEQPPTGGESTQVLAPADELTQAPDEPTAEPTQAEEPAPAPKTDRKGGWLDRIVFSAIPDPEPAAEQLKAGAIDMYAVSTDDAAVFEDIKSNPDLKYSMIYGSSNQMLFNPVKCTDENVLNPFTSQKIREAMNWATDREYISQEIMSGLARPRFVALTSAFPDYARYADILAGIETKYAFDMDKARAVISEEMVKMGAEAGPDGKWMYKGKPVTVIGLIRTEDRRKEIGNYFANQMEALGFTVDRQEKKRDEATPIWQQEDPALCNFTFYTAGWGAPNIQVDEGNMFVQYNTGKIQTLPVFNAFDPSPELLDASDRLFTANFNTMEERRELFEKALTLSMEESWWGVWVTDNYAYTPYRQGIEGSSDLAAGFETAPMYPYTLRFEGKEGGEMKIAQSDVLVDPWNPIAGSNWVDDSMIQKATQDWGVISDPYTGVVLPKLVTSATYNALEGLPIRKTGDWLDLEFVKEIKVPEDAWVDWDATTQKFITAKEKYPDGLTAKTSSMVVYTPELWNTTWHDGSKLTVADFVMNMILAFDPGKKESKIYDESLAPTVETYLSHFKGVRITSTDPLTIETYEDQYFLDAENSLTTWYPSQYVPTTSTNGMISAHSLVPAILAEENGEMAFNTTKATEKKIEWTSLLSGPTLDIQVTYLDQALAEKYIPYEPTMGAYLTADEAAARYENLKKWYEARKHLWIGTGPYFVDQVYTTEEVITVSHYDDYLFPADQFSGFDEPMIATASVEGETSVQAGAEAVFDVLVDFKDAPYPSEDIEKVSYIVFDANNDAVLKGEAENVGEGAYQVLLSPEMTSQIEAGAAKLSISVTSKVVSIPAFAESEFVVTE